MNTLYNLKGAELCGIYLYEGALYLLALEDMLIKLLLQSLIGKVDAQLLKAVLLEALKAIDIQDANRVLPLMPLACYSRRFSTSVVIQLLFMHCRRKCQQFLFVDYTNHPIADIYAVA